MGRCRGVAAAAACAAALAAPPAALASSGSDDSLQRGGTVNYVADPGEANQFTAESSSQGLHLRDTGAIIRWTSVPGFGSCVGGVHDVYCDGSWFEMSISLGDANDTFVNTSASPAAVDLGPGNDSAVGSGGAGSGYLIDGGPGADDIHGGAHAADSGFEGQSVTYEHATGPVNVSADNSANDGVSGERDNVHSDVHEIVGSAFGDRISGFSADGGAGNDLITGSAGGDSPLFGGDGNDVIAGGGGSDVFADWSGNNTFYARDGVADQIYCGTGHDTVYADALDVIETPPAYGGPCDEVHVG